MKHGFGPTVKRFERFIPLSGAILGSIYRGEEISKPRRIRFLLQELGPTAVKFGQWMSTRPDILPLEYIAELEKLQDRVPPFPFYQVREIIREELGGEIEDFYDYFSPTVIASGSIAQVHKAKLKDGTMVAVKILRPDVEKTIETDMEILLDLARLAGEHIIRADTYDPVSLVEEFSYAVRTQLDLWNEARNVERFRKNFEGVDYVRIPKPFLDFTTRRVLTIEYVDGIKINRLKSIEKAGLDRKTLAKNIADSYLKQVYVDGFFHGDPHPGNLFALPGNVVGYTDFGLVGIIDGETRKRLLKSLVAVAKRDSRELAEALIDLGAVSEEPDIPAFSMDLEHLLDKYYGTPLKKLNLGEMLEDVLAVMTRHHVRMPPNLSLLTIALWSMEGLVRNIDPDFNSFEANKPFLQRMISRRISPVHRLREFGNNVVEYYDLMEDLPRRLNRITNKIERGELKIIFRDERLENLNVVIDKASNRLIIGAIISTIIMGSAIVILSGREPVIFGIPLVEASFLAAGLMGIWLIISIMRSGKY
ncbi:MAG: AarF/ABC1/UbiB kinase family protein [Methanobacteriota archaeon]|nr:MAG: AarF/ABC1/UbiB kinase family protein [Euryarchaeota archaeon]